MALALLPAAGTVATQLIVAAGTALLYSAASATLQGVVASAAAKVAEKTDALFQRMFGDLIDEDDPPIAYSQFFAVQSDGTIPIRIDSSNFMPANYDPSRSYPFEVYAVMDPSQPGLSSTKLKECNRLGVSEVDSSGNDGKEDPKFTAIYRERISKLIDELNAKAKEMAQRGFPCGLIENRLVHRFSVKSPKIYSEIEAEYKAGKL